MRKKAIKTLDEANKLLIEINKCHDASIKRITFLKKRWLEKETGDLVYPFVGEANFVLCDVLVELLHSDYIGARYDQVVILFFKNVTTFNFFQELTFDYSDVYRVTCSQAEDQGLTFTFLSTEELIKSLVLTCREMIFKEK